MSKPLSQLQSAAANQNVDLTIYVPCYNEERLVTKTIETILEAVSGFGFSFEVLIFNDGSTDRTREAAEQYLAEHKLGDRFRVIHNETNRGIGVNYFRAAEMGRGAYFMGVAGDDGEPSETMRRVFNLMGKADVIIPYFDTRLFLNLGLNGDTRSFMRRLISVIFASLVRLLSGHHIHYFNGCILHKRENVLKYRVESYGLGYQAEMLCRILSAPGARFLEVKVFNRDRAIGKTTAFKPKNVASVLKSLWRIFQRRLTYRPTAA